MNRRLETQRLKDYIRAYPKQPTSTTIEILFMIAEGLITIDERIEQMAIDRATFDAALTDFLNELSSGLSSGLAAIQAKLDAAGAQIDLTSELGQINDAKAALEAQVAADTGTPAEPAVDTGTPAADTNTETTAPAGATDESAAAAANESEY